MRSSSARLTSCRFSRRIRRQRLRVVSEVSRGGAGATLDCHFFASDRFGRRRGWILLTQVVMVATLLATMTLRLPEQLVPGAWCWLSAADLASINT